MNKEYHKTTRNKFTKNISLLLYYGFAYWLPNFDSRFGGKVSNAIRVWCVKNIFEYVGQGVNIGRKAWFGKGSDIRIGSRSSIGAYCQIPSNMVIGNDVMMGLIIFSLEDLRITLTTLHDQ